MTQQDQDKPTWFDWYERIFDNVLRILWLILLIMWINSAHTIFK